MHTNIVFLGPPGSGKGTQAKNLAEKLGYFYFGTGDMMRLEIKNKTEYGQKFAEVIGRHQGELVPDELVETYISEKSEDLQNKPGIVFDGFPRTLRQAQFLEKMFDSRDDDFVVLDIEVSDKSLIERMQTRRICEDCGKIFFKADLSGIKVCDRCNGKLIRREEDEPDVVKKRLDVYEHATKPLIDFFTKEGRLIAIDGEQSIEDVEKEIIGKISK